MMKHVMEVIWKIVITFEKTINTMETILLHIPKVFYRGILKESNFQGTIVPYDLLNYCSRWRHQPGPFEDGCG